MDAVPTGQLVMTDYSIVLKSWKKIFEPDCGTLRDILAPEATANDWQSLLDYLSTNHKIQYSEDGTICSLPPFETIGQRREKVSVALSIQMGGYTINSYFFIPGEIEMDLLPDEINSENKAKSVFDFLSSIARVLDKEVFLTGEGVNGNVAQLRNAAVLFVNSAGQFSLRPEFANGQEPTTETAL